MSELHNLSGAGNVLRHKFRILDWGPHKWGSDEHWITIAAESSISVENYPYKEPFITWVAWCALFERLFRLPITY